MKRLHLHVSVPDLAQSIQFVLMLNNVKTGYGFADFIIERLDALF